MTGQTVGHYRIGEQLGSGGMGVVYRATDTRLDREVALKFLPRDQADEGAQARFSREARAAAALNHPNICTIHDVGEHEGRRFIAMELLEGASVKDTIAAGAVRPSRVLEWGGAMAAALESAHAKGIIHRDIKPANIFITRDGRVKVLDFGIAKLERDSAQHGDAVTAAHVTAPGAVVGTLAYMSPEQLLGDDLDSRTDLFSLGAVLYEMSTAAAPFRGPSNTALVDAILHKAPPNPIRLNPDIPPELDAIIMKALEKDRALRYQHASELRADLARVASRLTSATASTSPPPPSARVRARWPWIAAVVAGVAVAAGVVLWQSARSAQALGEADVIVLGDIVNRTGDPIFDDALRQAVAVKLEESPYLNVLPDTRVREALRLMNRPADTRLAPEIARELCQRQQLKAMLTGDITAIGSHYAVTLHAVECATGETLARELVDVEAKEQVLTGVGRATTTVRERLGESLASIARLDTPIDQATTSSLDAMKALAQADGLRARGAREEAIAMYARAIEFDPDFALAHARLGVVYDNVGQLGLARTHRTRAFELRERASERERFYIESHYYSNIVHDDAATRATLEQWRLTYPRDMTPLNNLGVFESQRGRFDRAAQHYREALQISPSVELLWTNLANAQMILGDFADAATTLAQARTRFPAAGTAEASEFLLAFATGNEEAVERTIAADTGTPPLALVIAEALTATGRLREGRRRMERAAKQLQQRGLREVAATWLAEQADGEALLGRPQYALTMREAIERDKGENPVVPLILGAALAHSSPSRHSAEWIPTKPADNAPLGVRVARATIIARLASNAGRPADAVTELAPFEATLVLNGAGVAAMLEYGRALLLSGQSKAAVAQLRQLADHPGLDPTRVEHAAGLVWLARAYAKEGDVAEARRTYETFFARMRHADEDVPLVNAAKEEYSKLQGP